MSELTPFQWSIKLDNGEIFVTQAYDVDELADKIDSIRQKFLGQTPVASQTVYTPPAAPIQAPAPRPGLICQVCGAKAEIREGISKADKPYKIFRCTANPEITPKGDSHWMRD